MKPTITKMLADSPELKKIEVKKKLIPFLQISQTEFKLGFTVKRNTISRSVYCIQLA